MKETGSDFEQLQQDYLSLERKLSALYQTSELSSRIKQLEDLYPAIHNIVSSLIPAENFYIALFNQRKQTLKFAYFIDPFDDYTNTTFSLSEISDGMTAYLLKKGETTLCNEDELKRLQAEGEITIYGARPIDWLGSPLVLDDEIIGVVAVQTYNSEVRYSEKDKDLFSFIARHIVAAMERVKQNQLLQDRIDRRTKEIKKAARELEQEVDKRRDAQALQAALLEISELANQVSDISEFYGHIHQVLSHFINTENYYIALVDESGECLTFPYHVNEFNSKLENRKLTNGLTELVIAQDKEMLLNREGMEALEAAGSVQAKPTNDNQALSWLGCPLKVAGKVIGVINVQSFNNEVIFNESDLQLLKFAADHIAQAISNKLAADNMLIHQSQLEQEVDQRTRALTDTNLKLQLQIEKRKKVEDKLYHDAHHDALTGLPNRALFQGALKRAVAHKKRDKTSAYAVLFIDLDRFKVINDTLGHHAGDLFLIEVSQRIQTCIREHDVLARLGGDEFVILLNAFENEKDCIDVASRIINALSSPYTVDNQQVYSGASIGITEVEAHYKHAEDVLRDADTAMYHAKAQGKGRYIRFTSSMHDKLMEELEMENQLRKAVENQQIEIYFQPISNFVDKKVIAYESLLSWRHPDKGELEAKDFLKIAEDSGLILPLDLMVIEQACNLLKQWQYQGEEYKNIKLHLNISHLHLSQPGKIDEIIDLVKHSGIVPFRLVLEIDENSLSRHANDCYEGIKALKKAGIQLALDHFGSGLASLNYLYNYPFDYVKIDQRFVRSMIGSHKHLMLIMSAQSVAAHVGFSLIATGLDTPKQAEKLAEIGCKLGQGNLIGAPQKLVRLDDAG